MSKAHKAALAQGRVEGRVIRTYLDVVEANRPKRGRKRTVESITKRLNEEYQLPVILWSVDPLDWKIRKASHVSNHILQNTNPGSIVLAHDIHPSTIDAMPAAIDGLLAKGYRFVTVSELIAMDGAPAPVATPAPTPPEPITTGSESSQVPSPDL